MNDGHENSCQICGLPCLENSAPDITTFSILPVKTGVPPNLKKRQISSKQSSPNSRAVNANYDKSEQGAGSLQFHTQSPSSSCSGKRKNSSQSGIAGNRSGWHAILIFAGNTATRSSISPITAIGLNFLDKSPAPPIISKAPLM